MSWFVAGEGTERLGLFSIEPLGQHRQIGAVVCGLAAAPSRPFRETAACLGNAAIILLIYLLTIDRCQAMAAKDWH